MTNCSKIKFGLIIDIFLFVLGMFEGDCNTEVNSVLSQQETCVNLKLS